MLDLVVTLIGISGVFAIGSSILLESLNKLDRKHHIFSILNLYGNSTLFFYSYYNWIWLFFVLNGFLFCISLYSVINVYKN